MRCSGNDLVTALLHTHIETYMEDCMTYQNNIRDKSYAFAKLAVRMYCLHSNNQMLRPLLLQFVRSATSVGANVEEAVAAESRADFRHKMTIAYKEARETAYWLRLFVDTEIMPKNECNPMYEKGLELVKILFAICRTAKKSRSDN